MRKILPLILTLICSSVVYSQALTVPELQAKAKAAKLKDLTFKYDKFKDRSIVSTKPENLVGSWEGGSAIFAAGMTGSGGQVLLFMSVATAFKGDKLLDTSDIFAIGFESTSKGQWQFLKGDKNLYVLYGDSRLELEPTSSDADISFNVLGSHSVDTNESLFFLIKRDDLEKIANAQKVEMQLGDSKPRAWKNNVLKRIQALLAITKL